MTINGESKICDEGASVAAMLSALGINPKKVAVERNRDIIPRATLDEVKVEEGDTYEIVHFVGGG